MRRSLRAHVLAGLLLAGASRATEPIDPEHGEPPAGTLALLQWPALTGTSRGLCPESPAQPQPLLSAPAGGDRAGELLPPEALAPGSDTPCTPPRLHRSDGSVVDLPTRELGYEEIALIAGERRDDRVQVFTGEAWSWVRIGDGARYHPIETLLPERMGYLSGAFGGRLCDVPGDADRCAALPSQVASDDLVVRALSSRRIDGRLWLEIELHDNVCEVDEPQPRARGWLPALDGGGRWTVWFYSRGC